MSAVGLRTGAGSFDERTSPRAARRCFGVFAVLLVGLALMAAPARADFAAEVAAYDAGNYAKAYAEFLPLARGGDSAAQYILGNMYRRGQGMARDNAEAVRWYRKAADQGHAFAQDQIYRLEGRSPTKPPATARRARFAIPRSRRARPREVRLGNGLAGRRGPSKICCL